MHSSPEDLLDLSQFGSHTFLHRPTMQCELAFASLTADMRETEEIKRLRLNIAAASYAVCSSFTEYMDPGARPADCVAARNVSKGQTR